MVTLKVGPGMPVTNVRVVRLADGNVSGIFIDYSDGSKAAINDMLFSGVAAGMRQPSLNVLGDALEGGAAYNSGGQLWNWVKTIGGIFLILFILAFALVRFLPVKTRQKLDDKVDRIFWGAGVQ